MSKWFIKDSSDRIVVDASGSAVFEQITLPSEYQEVRYIQSTGTQYINTGYVIKSNNLKFDLDAAWTGSASGTFASYFGFMKSSSATNPRIGLHNYSGTFMYGCNATINTDTVDKKDHAFVLSGNGSSQSLSIDGEIVNTSSTAYDLSSNTLSLFLFARNLAGASNNLVPAKIYRFKLTVDGRVQRYMFPCYRKSDNVIGMYDIIGNTFYPNSGSGNFLKGHNIID